MEPLHEFRRKRWSNTRSQMDTMTEGQTIKLPLTEFNNANTNARRLKFAYDERALWTVSKKQDHLEVTMLKDNR